MEFNRNQVRMFKDTLIFLSDLKGIKLSYPIRTRQIIKQINKADVYKRVGHRLIIKKKYLRSNGGLNNGLYNV
jgi:hypothetical protein